MIQYIVKRDVRLEKWDVILAFTQPLQRRWSPPGMTTDFASNVAKAVEGKVNNLGEPKVDLERVQDFVERALMDAKLYEAAINYIIYRRERAKERENDAVLKDTCQVIDSYIDEVDWRVAENSNIAHSFQGMMLHLSGTMQSRYTLEKFSQEIRDAHKHGFFHIHDLSFGLAATTPGWSLKDLLLDGFIPQ
jgi:ribonucleoside-triphosphate reductase